MKLQLEELGYQRRAIDTILNVFAGQPRNTNDTSVFFDIKANVLMLTSEQIAANKRQILVDNNVPENVAHLAEELEFCVEMETGTGKTLVYIRTIYELYRQSGFSKFIILVPSIAIREGVINTFKTFEDQLHALYGFKVGYFEYSSKRLNQLRHFVSDTQPQAIVMTIQSFSSDDRIINQGDRDDTIMGLSYIEALSKTSPIIIMDEPQEGMDTPNSIERIAAFQPLCKIRYSATHRPEFTRNLLYRLTPSQAYQLGMVKKLEVLTVAERNDEATLKIEVAQVKTEAGKPPKVKLRAWRAHNESFRLKETPWLKKDDDLAQKTDNPSYQGYVVDRIYKGLRDQTFRVTFANGAEIKDRDRNVTDFEGIFRQQLYWLIRMHFEKKDLLRPQGIKCLSLIFIDRVDNYMGDDPMIKRLFAEEYSRVVTERGEAQPSDEQVENCQGYYFAKTQAGSYTDDENSMKKNQEIFDLILRDKESLLALDNPVEFIFSHSALGVGWDNPNVFNIATLNHTFSEIRKRQEIGRGLRICVNEHGHRVYDPEGTAEGNEINLLTLVPNETYETFASRYQDEIRDQFGTAHEGIPLRQNTRGQRVTTKLTRNEGRFTSVEFRAFWEKLAIKTDYVVRFDEDRLVQRVTDALNEITVPEYEAEIVLTRVRGILDGVLDSEEIGREVERLRSQYAPLDIVEELSENTALSYPTAIRVVKGLTNLPEVVKNPPAFIQLAIRRTTQIEHEEMLRAVQYNPTGETISLALFKPELLTYSPTQNTPNKGIYDKVICDSDSQPERNFAIRADSDNEVVCFLKLPSFYRIPTPRGYYNPDFGVVIRRRSLKNPEAYDYYFVVETKSTNDPNDTHALTEDERYKIECARKHFAALGILAQLDYQVYHGPVKEYDPDFKSKVPHL